MEDAERDRLLAIVVASDEVILDEGDSPDPVAERRITQALRAKGRALGDLERYAESVLVWDEILARLADNPPTANARITLQALANKAAAERALGRDNNKLTTLHALLELAAPGEDTGVLRLVAAALNRKRELLIALERQADAIGVDDEIVRQLNGVDDPNLRTFVAYALTRKSQVLLTMGARFPEAMKASDELVARLEHEPSDTAVTVAELISAHMEHLTRTGQPTPPSILANVSLTLAMMASESASELARRQPLDVSRLPGRRLAQKAFLRLADGQINKKLTRYRQALAASDAVVTRSEASDDPELKRLAAQTRIQSVTALTALGRIREVIAVSELMESGDPSVIAALGAVADNRGQANSALHQIQTIALLATRARALGGKNQYIQRVAYDDSMRAHQAQSPRSLMVKVIERVLRPRDGPSDVPDDASDILR